VTTNYMREQVIDHFKDGKAFGVKIIYPSDIGRCSHVGCSIVAEEYTIGDNIEIEELVVGVGL